MPEEMPYFTALLHIAPEVMLTVGLCAVLVFDLITGGRQQRASGWLSLLTLAITAGLLLQRWDATADVFGMVRIDRFATLFKLFVTSAVAIVVGFDMLDRRNPREGKSETYFLLLTATLGSFFLVGSYNLLLIYLGLETLGLSSYALSGMHKRYRASAEASLKYVVYGALASGILLYGATLLYGMAGSLDLREIQGAVAAALNDGRTLQVALPSLMVLVGFGFKLSAFPFQWWAPDVYEGVTTPVATFLAVGSKGVALAAFIRYLAATYADVIPADNVAGYVQATMDGARASLSGILALVAAATMIFGNLAAIRQNNLKRLLAYSSISHAGYILVGAACMSQKGFEAATLYTLLYYFMNLGAFGVVIYFANQTGSEEIEGLNGLGWKHPLVGVAAVVFLVSLTGLPPTAGFAGKWYVLMAAWESGLGWLALVMVVMSVVSLFYYFRIARALFLRPELEPRPPERTPALAGMLAGLAIASVFFMWFEPLRVLAADGVRVLIW